MDKDRPGGGTVASLLPIILLVGAFALLFILWHAADVFLLFFAGVLMAVFLRLPTDFLKERTPLPDKLALGAVVLALMLLLALGGRFFAPRVAVQVAELRRELPRAALQVEQAIESYGWGASLLAEMPTANELLLSRPRQSLLSRITGVFSTTFEITSNFLIILFIGMFLAADPQLYQRGAIRLVPPTNRKRAGEVLSAMGGALRGWLLGQLTAMLVVGVLTSVGLWALGIPIWLTLGLLAAMLEIIPNLGPVLAAVPAVLVALMTGPSQALSVLLLFIAIQQLESNLLTPLVLKQTARLPPAVTITAMLLLGVLFGLLGLIVAAPLLAVTLVAVRMLYIEDFLGDRAAADDRSND